MSRNSELGQEDCMKRYSIVLDVESTGVSFVLLQQRVLFASKDSRRALIQRSLGIQRRVQTQEQNVILEAMTREQTTGNIIVHIVG
jgi:hypothetical protein